eukprot:3003511-Prymnesium_polylepis.1
MPRIALADGRRMDGSRPCAMVSPQWHERAAGADGALEGERIALPATYRPSVSPFGDLRPRCPSQ